MTIAAVIVAYEPDISELTRCVKAVVDQVDYVILMDNSETDHDFSLLPVSKIIRMDGNEGIAKAQNVGVCYAQNMGAGKILFLDQDSFIYHGAVRKLCSLMDQHMECAAVGPRYLDFHSGEVLGGTSIGWRPRKSESKCEETDTLISSGMLIRSSALETVGPLREDFFIDYVDTEWCFRASGLGYTLLVAQETLMEHHTGLESRKAWVGGWKSITVHEAERYRNMFRNGLRLVLSQNVPLQNRLYVFRRLLGYLYLVSIMRIFKPNSLRNALKGMKDGWVLGALSEERVAPRPGLEPGTQ